MMPIVDPFDKKPEIVDPFDVQEEKEGLWKGFLKPTLKAIPRVAGATAGSFAAFPVAGVAGLGKLLATGSLEEAEKTMRGIQEIPQRLITTPEEAKGMENIGLAMKPFEMAGQGWKDIVGLTPLKETIAEPIAGTIGEASAMFGLPGAKGRITKPITELRAMGEVLKPIPEPFIPSPNLRSEIAKSERIGAPVTIPPVRPSAEPMILEGAPTRTPVDQMRFEAISQKPSFEWTGEEKVFMDRFGASDAVQPTPEPSIVVPQTLTPRETIRNILPPPRLSMTPEPKLLGQPPDWIPGKPKTILRPMGASGFTAGQSHQVLPDGRVVVIPRLQAPVAPVGETLAPPRMVMPPPREEVIKPQVEAQVRPETPPPMVFPESVAPPSTETLPIPLKPLEGVPEKVAPAPSGEAVKGKELTFDEFEREYRTAYANMNKYTTEQVGRNIFADKMAELSDSHPDWVEIIENKKEPPKSPIAEPAPSVLTGQPFDESLPAKLEREYDKLARWQKSKAPQKSGVIKRIKEKIDYLEKEIAEPGKVGGKVPTVEDNLDLGGLNSYDRLKELQKRFPDERIVDLTKLSVKIKDAVPSSEAPIKMEKVISEPYVPGGKIKIVEPGKVGEVLAGKGTGVEIVGKEIPTAQQVREEYKPIGQRKTPEEVMVGKDFADLRISAETAVKELTENPAFDWSDKGKRRSAISNYFAERLAKEEEAFKAPGVGKISFGEAVARKAADKAESIGSLKSGEEEFSKLLEAAKKKEIEHWQGLGAVEHTEVKVEPSKVGKVETPKEQKKYLIDAIDEAIKEAPKVGIEGEYAVIEIPGDGVFKILNNKDALAEFKNKTKGFPGTAVTTEPKRVIPAPSFKPTGKRLSDFEGEYYNEFKPRKEGIIEVATDRNFYRDGWYSNGYYAIKTEKPTIKGTWSEGEQPDIKAVIPKTNLVPAEIVGENYQGTGTESQQTTVFAHFLSKTGESAFVNAKFVDSVLTKYPDAKPFVQSKDVFSSPILFKSKGDPIAVVMPMRIEADMTRIAGEYERVHGKPMPTKKGIFGSESGAISTNLLGLGLPKVAKNIWEKGKEAGIYNKYLNRFAAIEDTIKKARELGVIIKPGEDAGIRAREYLGIGGKVKSVLEDKTFRITPEGKIEITGEGLNPILKDYDAKSPEKKVDVRESDLQEYMIARRTIEDLQRPKNEWNKEFIATPQQVSKAKADMSRLNQKYGNNLGLLEETANRLYDYQKRVLSLLVDSGNMSAETYQNILNKNPHYVPFDRIIDAEGAVSGGMPVAKKPFTGAWSPVKKIKGSELEIQNTLESIIKNTYRIMDVSERNIVARNVATLKDIPELGITEVEAPIVPMGKVKHHAVIDPKFRESITNFATSLGAKFKTGKEVVPGRAFGTYQPGTKTAMHRQATPESTFAHEAGHFFDDEFGLKDRFYKRGATKEVAEELIVHMKNIGESKNRLKKPEERFARGFEWWLTQRALAEKDLPKFSASMEKIISEVPELKPLLNIRPSAEKAFESQTQTIWGKSPFVPKGNIIEVFEGGKRKFYEVPKNLYESMTGLNETSSGLFIKLMSIPANILRTGATITPEFALRNPIRDQWTAFMQTQLGFRPFIDPVGAVADILGKKERYYDWLRAGGAYSTFTELSRPNLRKTVNDLTGNKSLLSNLNIISRAQDVSQLFEQATRLGVFKAGERKGLTPVEAAFESRESTIDFARRGAKTKDLNRVIAFFNAGVQSLDKSIRSAAAHPASFTAKGIATITIPSALLYMVNRNDADYFEKPQWERDLFWMTKGPGGYYIRIPKPFLYGQVFGSSVERFLSHLDKTDPEAFKGFIKTLIDAATPVQGDPAAVIIPTGLKPLIENETNWSFFKQRSIIPQGKVNLIPEEQYGRYTPESAKAIGRTFGVSPSKVENLATGIAGGTGRYALEAADIAGRLTNILPPKETQRPTEVTDIPAMRGFVSRRAESSPESIQRLFERFKEVDQAHATLSSYERTGTWERVPELLRKYPEIVQYDALKIGVDTVRDLNQDIDLILKSRMPMDQKETLLRDIERKRMEVAQKINRLMPKMR